MPEDASVASRVTKLASEDSPLMRQAIGAGLAGANRRGLMNSSIATGAAVGAGLSTAATIASQDAQQVQQMNLAQMEDSRTRDISKATIASQDRNSYASTMAQLGKNYSEGIANTLQNDKIPTGTRTAAQGDMASLLHSQQQQLGALYGVNLTWG